MLIELEDGQVILAIDGMKYRPDDVLPDGTQASTLVEGELLDGSCVNRDLAQRFLASEKRRRQGHPRNPDCPVVISAKVPKRVKEWYLQRAAKFGVSMASLVARELEARYSEEVDSGK